MNFQSQDKQDTPRRSDTWKRIWEKKYKGGRGPIHKLDGFDLLTEEEWSRLVAAFCQLMGPFEGADVLEVGCGAGAFLQNIPDASSLAGIDYSESAVDLIKSSLEGQFFCADANDIPFQANSFDIIFSFGVFFYFDNLAYAEAVIREMFRVARPGARIFILEVNDAAKIEKYHQVRGTEDTRELIKKTDAKTTHLFFTKKWFEDLSQDLGAKIHILDEDELNVSFHSGSEYRFVVRFDALG